MVRDGIYYALAFIAVAILLGWFTGVWALAIIPLLLAAFFAWFFRDPERQIPQSPGAIVSPGDGKVTDIVTIEVNGEPKTRISIFLNVFNVHVNRSPIAGVIRKVEYRKGKFGNAMGAVSAEDNEQNIITVEGEGQTVIFKQIAGLLARRIVFTKQLGDVVARGERVGLIKFGSRVDVVFTPESEVSVKIGDHVAGGSTILAVARVASVPAPVLSESERGGTR
jgi:phosphatidylserine decarboxylase